MLGPQRLRSSGSTRKANLGVASAPVTNRSGRAYEVGRLARSLGHWLFVAPPDRNAFDRAIAFRAMRVLRMVPGLLLLRTTNSKPPVS